MYSSNTQLYVLSLILYGCKLVYSFLDVDELKGVKYGIEITKKPVLFSPEPLDNMLHLSSKYGQTYQCVMPTKMDENQDSKEANKTTDRNITVASTLNNTLHGECIFYTNGWWTYKLCYMKEITQFHEGENGIIQGDIISLGVFESEKEWNETDAKPKSKPNNHHTQTYTNGSQCELVGRPRQSVVKFFCNEETTSSIVSIDEPATCLYTIVVHSKALCSHPFFKPPKKVKPKEITCSPALTQDQYDQFVKKEQELKIKKEEERKRLETEAKSRTDSKKAKGLPELMQGLLGVGKLFDALVSADKKASKKLDALKSSDKREDVLVISDAEEADKGEQTYKKESESSKDDAVSDVMVEAENQGKGDEIQPNADSTTVEGESAPMDMETGQLLSKKTMSKPPSEEKFIERRDEDLKKTKRDLSVSPAVQKLKSLRKRLEEIDKKNELLKKQDRKLSDLLKKQYLRTKKKATDQIQGFKNLLQKLVEKKGKTKNLKAQKTVDLLIKKVAKNIKIYEQKILDLDLKMKASLAIGDNFDKRYEPLFAESAVKKNANSQKINDILNKFFKSNEKSRTNPVPSPGDKPLPDKGTDANQEALEEEEDIEKAPKKDVLDEVIKLLQIRSKKNAKKGTEKTRNGGSAEDTKSAEKAQEDSSSKSDKADGSVGNAADGSVGNAADGSVGKAADGNAGKAADGNAGKVRVKISKLGSDGVKLLEEQEKTEELSGTGSEANRLKSAGKKIEKMIKDKLKTAGVDIGANIKIKIITNDAQMSKLNEDESSFITQDTATQFKDMLVNLLGGGEEKTKEERRHSTLEDNYKFVYTNENNNEQAERTDEQNDNKFSLL